MTKIEWQELTSDQRKAFVLIGLAQVTLIGLALRDLRKRPAEQIRGSKKLWTPIVFVNFIGPTLYFLVGRRRGPGVSSTVNK
jgi:hypothetical protein